MDSKAWSAQGTQLAINGDHIAELTSIRGPSESANLIDVTSHDSEGFYREVISGFLSGGEVSIEGNFLPGDTDGQAALHDALQERTVDTYTITLPTTPVYVFTLNGIVTAFEINLPFDDKATFTSTITVTGKPEWTQGS